MLCYFKWTENFQACRQLAMKNESKESPPFWTFFDTNVTLWSVSALFFIRFPKGFIWIRKLISCNPRGGNFLIFFHIFSSQHTTRSYSYMCLKMYFSQNLVLLLQMAVFKRFWWKHSHGPLGVNILPCL